MFRTSIVSTDHPPVRGLGQYLCRPRGHDHTRQLSSNKFKQLLFIYSRTSAFNDGNQTIRRKNQGHRGSNTRFLHPYGDSQTISMHATGARGLPVCASIYRRELIKRCMTRIMWTRHVSEPPDTNKVAYGHNATVPLVCFSVVKVPKQQSCCVDIVVKAQVLLIALYSTRRCDKARWQNKIPTLTDHLIGSSYSAAWDSSAERLTHIVHLMPQSGPHHLSRRTWWLSCTGWEKRRNSSGRRS